MEHINYKRVIITFLITVLVCLAFLFISWSFLGDGVWPTMAVIAFLCIFYGDKNYYGFIHGVLMTAAVAGSLWAGIWGWSVVLNHTPVALNEILSMLFVAACSIGLYVLGGYYLMKAIEL